MTEQKANEIFKTKYPEGEIRRKNSTSAGSKYWVIFNPEGKVYYYSATSYQELLRRFGFKVLYKHDVNTIKREIESLKNKVTVGGEENHYHLFWDQDFFPYSEDEMQYMQKEINRLEELLSIAIISD